MAMSSNDNNQWIKRPFGRDDWLICSLLLPGVVILVCMFSVDHGLLVVFTLVWFFFFIALVTVMGKSRWRCGSCQGNLLVHPRSHLAICTLCGQCMCPPCKQAHVCHQTIVRCRKCGYILRGLVEPRCPECGTGVPEKHKQGHGH